MGDTITKRIEDNQNKIRFHTPSHAGSLSKYDITETCYSDNLLFSTDVLKSLEEKIAKIYKSDVAFISTQGATFSIFQAIYSCLHLGAFLIVGDNHVSIFNALRMFDATSYHIDTFNLDNVEKLGIKIVIITSPNYCGIDENLELISSKCKEKGLILIIDSAHGSHYIFSDQFKNKATEYGDLVVCSLHKTLPVITGGSILLAKKEFRDKLNAYRKMNHSTSPNYLTISSIEKCMDRYVKEGKNIYSKIIDACNNLKLEISKQHLKSNIQFLDNDDLTRLVITSSASGKELYNYLFNEGIVPEAIINNGVIFIVNEFNYEYLNLVKEALIKFNPKTQATKCKVKKKHNEEKRISSYFNKEPILVPVEKAIGKSAFFDIGLYPPGTPVIYSGDIILKEDIEFLENNDQALEVFGIENGFVYIFKD